MRASGRRSARRQARHAPARRSLSGLIARTGSLVVAVCGTNTRDGRAVRRAKASVGCTQVVSRPRDRSSAATTLPAALPRPLRGMDRLILPLGFESGSPPEGPGRPLPARQARPGLPISAGTCNGPGLRGRIGIHADRGGQPRLPDEPRTAVMRPTACTGLAIGRCLQTAPRYGCQLSSPSCRYPPGTSQVHGRTPPAAPSGKSSRSRWAGATSGRVSRAVASQ
jgi:hypothetical protein